MNKTMKINRRINTTIISTRKLLHKISCRKCKSIYHPPVFCCINGHTLCPKCLPQMIECNVCQGKITSRRNFLVEEMYENLIVPCKNRDLGCKYEAIGEIMRDHNETCDLGLKSCPVIGCKWKGDLTWLTKHFLQIHKR